MNSNARVTFDWTETTTTRRHMEVRVEWLAEKLEIENWRSMSPDDLSTEIDSIWNGGDRIEDMLREYGRTLVLTSFEPPETEIDDLDWDVKSSREEGQ